MTNVENFLKLKEIKYILHEHPAVYTCEEADDWLIKNVEIYSKAIDEINPLSVLVDEK